MPEGCHDRAVFDGVPAVDRAQPFDLLEVARNGFEAAFLEDTARAAFLAELDAYAAASDR